METNAAYIEANPQIVGGRVGIVMGLFAFACTYITLLFVFGWIGGIAIGWLPSALVGWITAFGCDKVVTYLMRGSPMAHAASPKG